MLTHAERLANLRDLFRRALADQGVPVAPDALLDLAMLAKVTHYYNALLPNGTYVLAWDQGKTRAGDRALVAWHPNFGLDPVLQAQCYVKVVS